MRICRHLPCALISVLVVMLAFSQAMAQPGVVAKWTFDASTVRGDTAVFADVSGNGHDVRSRAVGSTAGIVGNALLCNNSLFEMTAENSIGLELSPNQFTIETWVYADTEWSAMNPSAAVLFSNGYAASGVRQGSGFYVAPDGLLNLNLPNANGSEWYYAVSSAQVPVRTWVHVAATYDASVMRVYINGVLQGSTSMPGGYNKRTQPLLAHIGCSAAPVYYDATQKGHRLFGKLDEMTLYSMALSADTLRAHFVADTTKIDEINFGMPTVYAQPGDEVWVPIRLANHEDFSISSVQFDLRIDTSVIMLMGVSRDSGLAPTWMLIHNSDNEDSIPIAMGGSSTPLSYGEGELLRCLFKVRSPLASGRSSDLRLTNISIDENHVVVATNTPGRLIVGNPTILYGDVTGNKLVNAVDAQKILENVVGLLKLPHPTVPNFTTAVADVSGNGSISSYDAALVFQYSVGLIAQFPCQSGGQNKRIAKAMAVPTASLSLVLSSAAGPGEVVYDVVGTNLKGFVAGEFGLEYDPRYVDMENYTGDLRYQIRGASLKSQLEPSARHLKVALTTTDDIDENTQTVLFRLTLPTEAVTDPMNGLVLSRALINEGRIPTNIPSTGLTPSIGGVSEAAPRLSGLRVTASRNWLEITGASRGLLSVRLFDVGGRCVFSSSAQGVHRVQRIDTKSVPAGAYVCTVRSGRHARSTVVSLGR